MPVLAVTSDEPSTQRSASHRRGEPTSASASFLKGDIDKARVNEIVIAARSPDKLVLALRPGTLVVTPGDRSDLIVTTALARTSGHADRRPAAHLRRADGAVDRRLPGTPRFGDLPVLTTELQTYDVAVRLNNDGSPRPPRGRRSAWSKLVDHAADHIERRARWPRPPRGPAAA